MNQNTNYISVMKAKEICADKRETYRELPSFREDLAHRATRPSSAERFSQSTRVVRSTSFSPTIRVPWKMIDSNLMKME